jgi:hypothetical protein
MARESMRGFKLGRGLALAAGLLLVAGLAAQAPNPGKTPAKTADAPKFVLVTKDTSVAEMVGVINDRLSAQWKENKIERSAFCTDYEFIRRVTLDIIGRIAKPEEIAEYMAKPVNTRRSWLVDHLLASDEYPRNWANIWSNWLLTRAGEFGSQTKYHTQTHVWLEDQFAQNKKFNEIATALITAKGKNSENGAVNFILAHLGEQNPADKVAEQGHYEVVPITSRITRLFLGIQTQCTQCHDHPFDARLKQKDFWGINAFLRQVKRDPPPPRNQNQMMTRVDYTLIDDPDVNTESFVYYEKRNGVVLQTKPVFLDGTKLTPGSTERRAELARLIVDHENFPKEFVNRMWAHFMGRGFVHPVDDFNEQNQPSNPELLNELAKKFKHYGFDQKMVIRWICNSNAYSLSCVANKTNDKAEAEPFFSRMLLKSMTPEQLFESLMVATSAEAAQTKDGKKVLRDQWMKNLISNFGDDEGNEVSFNGTIVQALLMMNGKDINDAISGQKATVAKLIAKNGANQSKNLNDLFMAALNRPPSSAEHAKIVTAMAMRVRDKEATGPWQDLFWALLNSNEFILNH